MRHARWAKAWRRDRPRPPSPLVALPVLVPLIVVALGRGGVTTAISTTEVPGGLNLAIEFGLDGLLTGGMS